MLNSEIICHYENQCFVLFYSRHGQTLTRTAPVVKVHRRCLQSTPVSNASSTYRAAICTELGKPMKIQEMPCEQLCSGQVMKKDPLQFSI